jgi:hypothetical protein
MCGIKKMHKASLECVSKMQCENIRNERRQCNVRLCGVRMCLRRGVKGRATGDVWYSM